MKHFLSFLTVLFLASTLQAEPLFEKIDLFESDQAGYALYRIPGIVVTAKGTVLAYCEARKNANADWGHIDILLRRSTDAGKTWSAPQKIAGLGLTEGTFERNPAAQKQKLGKPGEITFNNPVAIASRDGTVHFLFCVEYGRCFAMKSTDDGLTFSKPVEITKTFESYRNDYPWIVLATGPAHGIELKNGRLIVPVWLSTGEGGHAHRPSAVSVIVSDDQGKSWQPGSIVTRHPDSTNPSETIVVQLADGRVMLNIRSESKEHRRLVSISQDGATGWSKPTFDQNLPEPVCMASIVRLHEGGRTNRILFANPDNFKDRQRKNLTIRMSTDEGKTWPTVKLLQPGPSAYSDLAVGPDGTIFCFYERGAGENMYRTKYLTLARFNLDWLTSK